MRNPFKRKRVKYWLDEIFTGENGTVRFYVREDDLETGETLREIELNAYSGALRALVASFRAGKKND